VRKERVQRGERLSQMFEDVKKADAIELPISQGRYVIAYYFDLVR